MAILLAGKGATVDVFGYEVLQKNFQEDALNYRGKTRMGRSLRSSSIYLRDDRGKLIGAMCINMDITGLIEAQQLIDGIHLRSVGPKVSSPPDC